MRSAPFSVQEYSSTFDTAEIRTGIIVRATWSDAIAQVAGAAMRRSWAGLRPALGVQTIVARLRVLARRMQHGAAAFAEANGVLVARAAKHEGCRRSASSFAYEKAPL